ncbi:hypothetical protein QLX08_000678 [Tetragonisca angustula]|uniref:Uncharacterized protein n=1 Tax=Tetragonisca angustula TaxID=166442 RepID=A0AAW1AMF3_9HYME
MAGYAATHFSERSSSGGYFRGVRSNDVSRDLRGCLSVSTKIGLTPHSLHHSSEHRDSRPPPLLLVVRHDECPTTAPWLKMFGDGWCVPLVPASRRYRRINLSRGLHTRTLPFHRSYAFSKFSGYMSRRLGDEISSKWITNF